MTATPSPGRLSLVKAIGWSVAFVILTLFLATLIGVGAAGLIAGSVGRGAAWLNQVTAGPILLQGDHGRVEFRNVVLTPAAR